MPTKKPSPDPTRHHYVRTTVASILGFIAIWLLTASILVVWANHTVTDQTAYLAAVGPLVDKPAIREFIANRATDQLLKSAPTEDLANELLAPADVAGKTPEELKAALQPVIHDSFVQITASPDFMALWKSTNESAHQQLISQLDTNSDTLTLDLSPAVTGVIAQFKSTKLAPIGDKITPEADTGKISLKGSNVEKAHAYYRLFKQGTVAIVVVGLLAALLAVLVSVHHLKTVRRILIATGVSALVLALLIELPSWISIGAIDPAMQKAVAALAVTLFHGLLVGCLILGIGCIVVALATKFYPKTRPAA